MSDLSGTPPYKGWTSPAYAINKRASQVASAQAGQVHVKTQAGTISVVLGTGAIGEGTANIVFAYQFVEKPIVSFGAELDVNQSPVAGSFPSISAVAYGWQTSPSGYATVWTGVSVAFTVSGQAGQKFFLHYSFSGNAMTGAATHSSQVGTA